MEHHGEALHLITKDTKLGEGLKGDYQKICGEFSGKAS
jgi:hypothetical protein